MPAASQISKRTHRELSEAEFRRASADLFRQDETQKAKLARYGASARSFDPDDEPDTPSPRYDLCLRAEGPDGVLKYTNFTPAEFDAIWSSLEDFVATHWNIGRGKKCENAAKDVFFMSVCSLKHCGKWDTVAHIFRIHPSTFQKMVRKFLTVITPRMYELFVRKEDDRMTMEKLVLSGNTFDNFKSGRYATDVTFQHANRLSGNHNEAISYYSGKHHLYGYKVEVSVLPTGLAINCSPHARGSVSDLTMFRENARFHVQALKKQASEMNLADVDPLHETFPREWAVLVDKGYQGLASDFRAIHPKKPRGLRSLSLAEASQNDRISHDRVIVENYFGRMKTLWAVCGDKWRWDESSYDLFFQACLALTNVHVRLRPLRNDDGDDYHRYEARLRDVGVSTENHTKEKRKEYQLNRKARVQTSLRRRSSDAGNVHSAFGTDDEIEETQL